MKMFGRGLVVLVLCALMAAGGWFYALHGENEEHQVLSREGVLMQIKQMNRLESTAFYIDTIIRTEKKGDWRRLWQDSQSGIFIVRGKVLAGLDLDKLGADNVNIVDDKVLISLPAVEILSVQEEAKRQVLQSACKAEILEHANRQAQTQLENLFALTQTKVSVYPAAVGKCG